MCRRLHFIYACRIRQLEEEEEEEEERRWPGG
jgi:hypothetical protein